MRMDRLYRVLVNAFALKSEIKCKLEKILTRRRPVSVSIRTVPNTPGCGLRIDEKAFAKEAKVFYDLKA